MAIVANQRVLTLDLWKLASEIKENDWVFNSDGKLVRVKLVQQYVSQDCYEVILDDHLTVCGDLHLAMMLETQKYRLRLSTYKGVNKFRRPLKRFTVKEALEHDKRLSIPTTKPINFPNQDLPVPPFIFGFWFFNRRYNKTMIAPRGMSDFVHQKFKDHGYRITTHRKMPTGEYEFKCYPSIESQLAPFIPNKIPNNYLFSSAEQRIELLSGIMYSKNKRYNPSSDWFVFTTTKQLISRQVQYIVESLGMKTNCFQHERDRRLEMFFKSRLRLIENQTSKPLKIHQARRYIQKIVPIKPQSCVHIEIDDENPTLLVGEGFISVC